MIFDNIIIHMSVWVYVCVSTIAIPQDNFTSKEMMPMQTLLRNSMAMPVAS